MQPIVITQYDIHSVYTVCIVYIIYANNSPLSPPVTMLVISNVGKSYLHNHNNLKYDLQTL